MADAACFIGVDVGTGSARAGVFDEKGRRLGTGVEPIRMWKPQTDFVEQSSEDIWAACGKAIRAATAEAGVTADAVRGVGFDATCSLVVLDGAGQPLSVSPTDRDEQNVIVWMDHRATAEAEEINAGGHEVLRYVGGRISPEMQTPKLLWLKRHRPGTFARAGLFLDLPDFLTWRATGEPTRSLCTTVCKWTYLGHEGEAGCWDRTYFERIGLGELAEEDFARIGQRMRPMGEPIGAGLTARAAAELGLAAGTPVAVGLIDAHAGGVGMLGAGLGETEGAEALQRRLALIGGTSSCHMAVSPEPRYIEGVWGPYFSAMVPGLWLTEGGQSATGALVDHVIFTYAQGQAMRERAEREGTTVYELLNRQLEDLAAQAGVARHELTRRRHVLPYFHGNRSPRANPDLRGIVAGLKLDGSEADLALTYQATIQAIACGTRHIIEAMNQSGYRIDTILACGGGTKNPVFLQEHADVTGCRIILPREPEAVLLGSAILGAVAGGRYPDIPAAMAGMTGADRVVEPRAELSRFYDCKYHIFMKMYEDWRGWEQLMAEAD